jgi:hypothetical protein
MAHGKPLISPAHAYRRADDLAVVSCFFNSQDYQSKQEALEVFSKAMRSSGIPLYMAGATLGGEDSVVAVAKDAYHFRGGEVMWQKERLLNLLIRRLPARFTKIAWIDADILFENPDWAVDTSRLLNNVMVVQPYSHCFRLRPHHQAYNGEGERLQAFTAVRNALPRFAQSGPYELHGHTGYAWAARREFLTAIGLYDAAIGGTADHLMAHAFAGDFASQCIRATVGDLSSGFAWHFRHWAESAWDIVHGSMGVVDGAALHLWHGEHHNRGYVTRNTELISLGFDPLRHLVAGRSGLWRWSSDGQRFRGFVDSYFKSRFEDTECPLTLKERA